MLSPVIQLQKESKIAGVLIALAPTTRRSNDAHIRLDSGSVVVGHVFADGNLEVQGSIIGNAFAKRIVLHTRAGIYDNHLLNAVLNADSLAQPFAGVALQYYGLRENQESGSKNKKYPARWLP